MLMASNFSKEKIKMNNSKPIIEEMSQLELREIAENFLRKLGVVRKQVLFYPEEHPILQESINVFKTFITTFIEDYARFVINFHESQVFIYNTFVTQISVDCKKTVDELENKSIKEITVLPGLTHREIYDFAKITNERKEDLESQGGVQSAIAEVGITHIMVTEANPVEVRKKDKLKTAEGAELTRETYMSAIAAIKEVSKELLSGRSVSVNQAKKIVDTMVDSVLSNPDTLIKLSVLKNYDEDTFYHSVNVLVLSLALGASIKLERASLSALGLSALLHDIGKIKIPVDILRKPTSLTFDEWEIVKKHPVYGAEALLIAKGLNKIAVVVALEHHSGYDKKGYPDLELMEKPHLFSRIVEVVDVYDALTSMRAYRKPTLPDNALRLIYSQGGKKLDPLLSKSFVRLMGIYPVGCVVKLNTEEYGIVVKPGSEDITRPHVKVLFTRELQAIEPPETVYLTNEARMGGKRTTILESIEPSKLGINPQDFIDFG